MKFKHIIISSFLLLSASTYAQNKELTNDLIWYSNEFSPDYLRGGESLKHKKVENKTEIMVEESKRHFLDP